MWSDEFEQRVAAMRDRNDRERLASRIGHEQLRVAEAIGAAAAMERQYTVQEIGEAWLSASTVARLFRDEPGVLKIGRGPSRRGRRCYTTLRVPQSVVERVHRRLTVELGLILAARVNAMTARPQTAFKGVNGGFWRVSSVGEMFDSDTRTAPSSLVFSGSTRQCDTFSLDSRRSVE